MKHFLLAVLLSLCFSLKNKEIYLNPSSVNVCYTHNTLFTFFTFCWFT